MARLLIDGREIDVQEQLKLLDRSDCEASLYTFLQYGWRYIDASPFTPGWPIEAVAEHLEAVADGEIKRLIINIPPRCAKPVSGEAYITTLERGLIRLKDARIGEYVLTHKGRMREIKAVHQQGVLPVLKITTSHKREVLAAADHPFLTTSGWAELKNIKPHDIIGVVPNFGAIGKKTIPPEEARLLGYLVGDGCCTGTPNITVADDIEAEDIARCIEAQGFSATMQSYHMAKSGYTLRRISLKGDLKSDRRKKGYLGPVKLFLEKHGLLNGSSYTKMVPEAVMGGSASVVQNFIGAYWACDGYVSTKGTKRDGTEREDLLIGCDSVNKAFLLQMQSLLLRLGINSILRKKTANVKTKRQGDQYTSYSLAISDQDNCWRFAGQITIPHSKNEKLVSAKKRRFDFDRQLIGEVVESVEPAGEAECFCLTVDEDESFVANGFAVHNSSLVSVCFPAWVWAQPNRTPTSGPGVQFLHASYAQQLSLRDSVKCRRLIESPWYQGLWGDRFKLTSDQNTKSRFDNDQKGSRLSTSVGSALTGEGGSIIVIDDPNAAQEAFSEATVASTIEWWDNALSTRLNDPKTGCYILIQQRLAEDDLTGHILEKEQDGWTHLCLPMRYEWQRHSYSSIGWNDPRGLDEDGEPLVHVLGNGLRVPRDNDAAKILAEERENSLLWEERFGEAEVKKLEASLGPYGAAGQLQQRPEPKGGGIIKSDWWQLWEEPTYPPMDFILASLDTAYTEKSENDPSALTVWGVFSSSNLARASKAITRDNELVDTLPEAARAYGQQAPRVMLMYAWQGRLELHQLVEKVQEICKKLKVDKLIVENKAAGHPVAQELRRLYSDSGFMVQLVDPKGFDKTARLYSVQHLFAENMIFCPDKAWSDQVIKQVGQFPKGKHDDLVDTVSMALRHLRELGMMTRSAEWIADVGREIQYEGKQMVPLYEV